MSETKKCPYCAEDIAQEAIKCRFCGEYLNKVLPTETIKQPEILSLNERIELREKLGKDYNPFPPQNIVYNEKLSFQVDYKDETLGIIALTLPVITILVTSYWLGGMQITIFNSDEPSRTLFTLSAICIGITSLLLAIEAGKLKMGNDKDLKYNEKIYEGPLTWFVYLIILWLVFFPWYYARRARYGLKNLSSGALIVAILFTCSTIFWSYQIEKTKSDLRNKIENFQNNFNY